MARSVVKLTILRISFSYQWCNFICKSRLLLQICLNDKLGSCHLDLIMLENPLKYFALPRFRISIESIVFTLRKDKILLMKRPKVSCSEEIHWSRQSFYRYDTIGSSMLRMCFYFEFMWISEDLDCSDSFRRSLVPFFWFINRAAGSVDV